MMIPWLEEARRHIGVREVPGAGTAKTISGWLSKLGAWWADDETAWCGVAVAAWMQSVGIQPPRAWYRAKAWLDWGDKLAAPCVGCVVVFERHGGGHVGLVVGKDTAGRLLVLGGNQGDSVKVSPFDLSRVAGYRWPPGTPVAANNALPVTIAAGAASRNEA
jgi:uncharacterized protein (TIGR02594 family)